MGNISSLESVSDSPGFWLSSPLLSQVSISSYREDITTPLPRSPSETKYLCYPDYVISTATYSERSLERYFETAVDSKQLVFAAQISPRKFCDVTLSGDTSSLSTNEKPARLLSSNEVRPAVS